METAGRHIVVVGGGAAGFFAAIAAAETLGGRGRVTLVEATAHLLAKVRISGGGRCNVTHACFDPRELIKRYPRGGRELLGPLHAFGPNETIAWFKARGVELKTEADGRMFPTTDDSGTIVGCLERAARATGVEIRIRAGVTRAFCEGGRWGLELGDGTTLLADAVILATGGTRGSAGLRIAEELGHAISPLVPSLFTFNIDDPRLQGLAGLAAPRAETSVAGSPLKQEGPLLVTHWGVSGPAVLKLSAWGARELAACDYRFTLRVNWAAGYNRDGARNRLHAMRTEHPRKAVVTLAPWEEVPSRLWERLIEAARVAPTTTWSQLSSEQASNLAAQLVSSEFSVTGKSTNKEEFVTCGGVSLKEVSFKTMESRRCPGLHFAGEVLDIDGVTGGFNFQAAWTTGWLAGRAAGTVGEKD